jgi:hypothetical protein
MIPQPGVVNEALFYPDLINQLRFQGANVNDHDKLFSQDYYSWCPPIDLDKFLNYRLYYWIPNPGITTIVGPYVELIGNGGSQYTGVPPYTNVMLLKVKVNGFDKVYNVDYTIIGVNIVFLTNPPQTGDIIQIWSHTNIDTQVIGQLNYTVGNVVFSSGLKVVFINDINPANNYIPYIVEGVGTYILLVNDSAVDTPWDTTDLIIPSPNVQYQFNTAVSSVTGIPQYTNVNNIRVFVNSVLQTVGINYTITNLTVNFTSPVPAKTLIQVFLYSDVSAQVIGQTSYILDGAPLVAGNIVYVEHDINPLYSQKTFTITIVDGLITFYEIYDQYGTWDDLLFPWSYTLAFDTNDYLTIARGSADSDPWSLSNRWFHMDVLTPSTLVQYPNNFGLRPIIEFSRNMQLYNYGDYTRASVSLYDNTITDIFTTLFNATPGIFTIDGVVVQAGMRILFTGDTNPTVNNMIYKVELINPTPTTSNFILILQTDGESITGYPVVGEKTTVLLGTVNAGLEYWWNGTIWAISQTKISINQAPLFELYDVNQVPLDDAGIYPGSNFAGNKVFGYQINVTGSTTTPDTVLGFIPTYDQYGNFVYQDFLTEPFNDFAELTNTKYTWNNGTILGFYFWQIFASSFTEQLFDNNWVESETPSRQLYVDDFTSENGQTVFILSQTPDTPVAGMPPYLLPSVYVTVNNLAVNLNTDFIVNGREIQFNNLNNGDLIEVQSYSSMGPTFNGGYYAIPQNLESNPLNENVQTLSVNQFYDQFNVLMTSQNNFTGSAVGVNNYRDIFIDRSLGNTILQNTAPLLRTMLFASDKSIDFSLAIHYVQREYFRFKNKYVQQIQMLLTKSTLTSSSPPSVWYAQILQNINLARTATFPFAYSGMGGNLTFIPATPAYLGLLPCWQPTIFLDTTYDVPRNVILGHDGSLFIAYNDFRDNIILYLEQTIYNSINSSFIGTRPLFDYIQYVENKWRKYDNFAEFYGTANAVPWTQIPILLPIKSY